MTHRQTAWSLLRSVRPLPAILAVLLAGAGATPGLAQSATTTESSAFAGLGENRNAPIQIEADQLEVRENDKTAVFSGNVSVRQEDATLRTQRLVVHYIASGGGLAGAGAGGGAPQQNISRLEATGRVLVTSKDQTATGESADFDVQGRKLVVNGNVTLTQGKNVLRGGRLVVDLASGQARMESSSQRVQMLLVPNSQPGAGKPQTP